LWIFNTNSMEWENPAISSKVPLPRYSHSATAAGSDMVVIGGKYKDDSKKKSTDIDGTIDVHWFNTELMGWWVPSLEGSAPPNRYAQSTVFHDGKVYVFGGFNGVVCFNDLYSLDVDPERRARKSELPPPMLGSDLKSLVNSKHFSDVIFLVEGRRIYGHKNILVSRSNYFRTMFLGKLRESIQDEIPISGVNYITFLAFLEYVYTESLDIDVNEAVDLLVLANLYQFDKLKLDLSYVIERYMLVENCCVLLQHAHHNQAAQLEKVCVDFVIKNFEVVKNSPGFGALEEELVESIMKNLNKEC